MQARAILTQEYNVRGHFNNSALKKAEGENRFFIVEANYGSLSTNALVKLCSYSPQHPAWDEFYRRFDKFIRLYVGKTYRWFYCNYDNVYSCSNEAKLEMAQEVYIKLLDDDQYALRRFVGKNDSSFLSYLARIIKNVVIEHFRKQQANKRKGNLISIEKLNENNFEEREKCFFQYLSINPESDLVNSINSGQMYLILCKMLSCPNSHRDISVLKLYIDGLSLPEINECLDLKLKTSSIESIINRTLVKLRRIITSPNPDPASEKNHIRLHHRDTENS